ncbi:hypothetical protein BJX68DRAFT_234926 [Aspergillus pseudodeflectus]|uniref:Uncharacterized protein n=1 Tax=Aspergillus pseudodeflectus TaxID=176178 RepID=A0ABR4KIR7_9EURO
MHLSCLYFSPGVSTIIPTIIPTIITIMTITIIATAAVRFSRGRLNASTGYGATTNPSDSLTLLYHLASSKSHTLCTVTYLLAT